VAGRPHSHEPAPLGSIPTGSHHLEVLREAGLIAGERRGTWIHYRVLPEALRQASAVLVPDEARL
jgi:ArsR family transcriptional regulator, arsenate/arsenite/antimonite-responsive transcriptional repressor